MANSGAVNDGLTPDQIEELVKSGTLTDYLEDYQGTLNFDYITRIKNNEIDDDIYSFNYQFGNQGKNGTTGNYSISFIGNDIVFNDKGVPVYVPENTAVFFDACGTGGTVNGGSNPNKGSSMKDDLIYSINSLPEKDDINCILITTRNEHNFFNEKWTQFEGEFCDSATVVDQVLNTYGLTNDNLVGGTGYSNGASLTPAVVGSFPGEKPKIIASLSNELWKFFEGSHTMDKVLDGAFKNMNNSGSIFIHIPEINKSDDKTKKISDEYHDLSVIGAISRTDHTGTYNTFFQKGGLSLLLGFGKDGLDSLTTKSYDGTYVKWPFKVYINGEKNQNSGRKTCWDIIKDASSQYKVDTSGTDLLRARLVTKDNYEQLSGLMDSVISIKYKGIVNDANDVYKSIGNAKNNRSFEINENAGSEYFPSGIYNSMALMSSTANFLDAKAQNEIKMIGDLLERYTRLEIGLTDIVPGKSDLPIFDKQNDLNDFIAVHTNSDLEEFRGSITKYIKDNVEAGRLGSIGGENIDASLKDLNNYLNNEISDSKTVLKKLKVLYNNGDIQSESWNDFVKPRLDNFVSFYEAREALASDIQARINEELNKIINEFGEDLPIDDTKIPELNEQKRTLYYTISILREKANKKEEIIYFDNWDTEHKYPIKGTIYPYKAECEAKIAEAEAEIAVIEETIERIYKFIEAINLLNTKINEMMDEIADFGNMINSMPEVDLSNE